VNGTLQSVLEIHLSSDDPNESAPDESAPEGTNMRQENPKPAQAQNRSDEWLHGCFSCPLRVFRIIRFP
jgi:hypothetical protein